METSISFLLFHSSTQLLTSSPVKLSSSRGKQLFSQTLILFFFFLILIQVLFTHFGSKKITLDSYQWNYPHYTSEAFVFERRSESSSIRCILSLKINQRYCLEKRTKKIKWKMLTILVFFFFLWIPNSDYHIHWCTGKTSQSRDK